MTGGTGPQPIRIPSQACAWRPEIYEGKEHEFSLLGPGGFVRMRAACACVRQLRRLLPSAPRLPGVDYDIFTALGRFYVEMHEFVEVAGATCRSAEAVAWLYEAALRALSGVHAEVDGRPIVLCPTPTDYNHYATSGQTAAHSTGCHINVLSPRALSPAETWFFAALLGPLNLVFGPGGLTFLGNSVRFSCDPRANHVGPIAGTAAHGTSVKPLLLFRNEPFASPPRQRLQVTGFGGPRSPLASWLQAELIPMALRVVLAGKDPPVLAADPVAALRAGPDEVIPLAKPRPGSSRALPKSELAMATIHWLAEVAHTCAAGPDGVSRTEQVRELSIQAVQAHWQPSAQPPVFPTDIAIKQYLFDHFVQAHGFADLSALGQAFAADLADAKVRAVLDRVVVADVLFGTPSDGYSTYQLAGRNGLFVRPEFEHPIDLCDLACLPEGVSQRDRARAGRLASQTRQSTLLSCDWDQWTASDGTVTLLPDPWSDPLPEGLRVARLQGA